FNGLIWAPMIGRVSAFDAVTGEGPVHELTLQSVSAVSGPTVRVANWLYFNYISNDGRFHAASLNLLDGSAGWDRALMSQYDMSSLPQLSSDGSTLYEGITNTVHSMDLASGADLWIAALPDGIQVQGAMVPTASNLLFQFQIPDPNQFRGGAIS